MKNRFFKSLGGGWAFYADENFKYTNLIPSFALIHDGQVWPIGFSVRFLWWTAALVRRL